MLAETSGIQVVSAGVTMTERLIHPWTDSIEFKVNLFYFLTPFEGMCRDWRKEFHEANINEDREVLDLVRRFLLSGKLVNDFTAEHKWVVMKALIGPLSTKAYDFDRIFEVEVLRQEEIALPPTWQIEEPRRFFELVYRAHYEAWHSELADYGLPTIEELRSSAES